MATCSLSNFKMHLQQMMAKEFARVGLVQLHFYTGNIGNNIILNIGVLEVVSHLPWTVVTLLMQAWINSIGVVKEKLSLIVF